MRKLDKGKMVNCLGFCNKQFYSLDPSRNRLCKKCQDKLKVKNNEMGRNYFYEKKVDFDD
jgi:hypothetical protein